MAFGTRVLKSWVLGPSGVCKTAGIPPFFALRPMSFSWAFGMGLCLLQRDLKHGSFGLMAVLWAYKDSELGDTKGACRTSCVLTLHCRHAPQGSSVGIGT